MIFQLLFGAAMLVCMFYFMVRTRRTALQRLFVVGFFSTAFFFVLQPELATSLALLVGIGRGADLILYVSTLFLFVICFSYYLRFRSIDEQLATIVRQLAIAHPIRESGVAPPAETAAGLAHANAIDARDEAADRSAP